MFTHIRDFKAGGDCSRRTTYLDNVINLDNIVGHLEDIRRGWNNAQQSAQQNLDSIHDIVRLTGEIVALRRDIRETTRSPVTQPTREKFSALPFTTLEEVCEFDVKLHEREDLVNDFKKLIQKSAGFDTPSFLRSALRKVFTDNLASKLRWKGTKSQKTADRCYCIKLMKDVCLKKYGSNESIMNIVLQEFFVHARDRLNNRLKILNNNGLQN